jgi:alpha/beta superfamily hydrolase
VAAPHGSVPYRRAVTLRRIPIGDVTLTTRDGLSLHGHLHGGGRRGAVLVCHPHTMNGGSMETGLVPLLAEALARAGFTVLRFDFRGAGRSEGRFGHGTGELLDVDAAIAHLRDAVPGLPLVLTGWSFGAAVSLRWLVDRGDADGWLGVAVALGLEELGVPTVSADELRGLEVPLSFVHGTEDDVAPLYRVRALTMLSDGAELHQIDGGTHFLQGHTDEVTDLAVEFVARVAAP